MKSRDVLETVARAALGAAVGSALNLAVNAVGLGYMEWWANAINIEPAPPPGRVSLQLAAYNEEAWIGRALESLNNQNIVLAYPEYFEKIVVDSGSTDRTAEIAESYGWTVLQAPRGKLNARDMAIRTTTADIVVGLDADCVYPVNSLHMLLIHFYNPDVVGVSGSTVWTDSLPSRLKSFWLEAIAYTLRHPRMLGRLSAFRREAYFRIGGFNLNINQFNLVEMFSEEEFAFWRKLSSIGKCVHELRAVAYASTRRFWCPVVGRLREYCDGKCMIPPEILKYCREIEAGERF
jgi:glycosyltransferase involved in cell wall biosynthesis